MMAAQKADATLSDAPRNRTLQPIVTGTTVIGLKYAGGVMLAADTLASYGSMARYKDFRRLSSVGENTILGASGEMSDFQVSMHVCVCVCTAVCACIQVIIHPCTYALYAPHS